MDAILDGASSDDSEVFGSSDRNGNGRREHFDSGRVMEKDIRRPSTANPEQADLALGQGSRWFVRVGSGKRRGGMGEGLGSGRLLGDEAGGVGKEKRKESQSTQ